MLKPSSDSYRRFPRNSLLSLWGSFSVSERLDPVLFHIYHFNIRLYNAIRFNACKHIRTYFKCFGSFCIIPQCYAGCFQNAGLFQNTFIICKYKSALASSYRNSKKSTCSIDMIPSNEKMNSWILFLLLGAQGKLQEKSTPFES